MLKQFFAAPSITVNRRFFRFLKANNCRQSFIKNFRDNEIRYRRVHTPVHEDNYFILAFGWHESPQSVDFWRDLHKKWLTEKERPSSRTDVPTNSN